MAPARGEDDDGSDHDDDGEGGKRRRVQRACDVCRKKKIRCDGLQPDKGACSNCATYGHPCTFVDATKRRAPPRSYVIALEARMERAEMLIAQLLPSVDIDRAIGPMPELPGEKKEGAGDGDEETAAVSMQTLPQPQYGPGSTALTSSLSQQSRRFASDPATRSTDSWAPESGEDLAEEEEEAAFIRVMLDQVSLHAEAETFVASFNRNRRGTGEAEVLKVTTGEGDIVRVEQQEAPTTADNEAPLLFYGKASGFHLVPHLDRVLGDQDKGPSSQSNSSTSNSSSEIPMPDDLLPNAAELDLSKVIFRWPTPQAQEKLVQIYFARANPQFPILNEVTFRARLDEPDWRTKNIETILLSLGVFSLGSRYLNDAEVDEEPVLVDCGIHWASLVRVFIDRSVLTPSSKIPYIQAILLSTVFIMAIPLGYRSYPWIALGVAVRVLQDMGAHRKFTASSSNFNLLTEETYRRLWWTTYVLDRIISTEMGRPVSIQDEDIDLDDILLIDDRYIFEANERGTTPQQPRDQPSMYHGFLQTVRLSQILGRTLRTIYAISKSKAERGFVGKRWDAYIVSEIDKSLNRWLEQVPSHLAYSPTEVNTDWLVQSSRIFLLYYSIQALVHRPYIQRYKLDAPLDFHSLAIVSNSSRAGIHIVSNLTERGLVTLAGPETPLRSFIFASHLLLISASAQQKQFSVSDTLLADVRKGCDALKSLSKTWKIARRMAARFDHYLKVASAKSTQGRPSSIASGQSSVASGKRSHDDVQQSRGDWASTAQQLQRQQQQAQQLSLGYGGGEPSQREIRGIRSSSSSLFKPEPNPSPRLPLSTAELQDTFGDSPPSAIEQMAALSGWQQNLASAGGSAPTSGFSGGMGGNPYNAQQLAMQATALQAMMNNNPQMQAYLGHMGNFAAGPGMVGGPPMGPSGFVAQSGGNGGRSSSGTYPMPTISSPTAQFGDNRQISMEMAPSPGSNEQGSSGLRYDAFLGGTLLPTPAFELDRLMFAAARETPFPNPASTTSQEASSSTYPMRSSGYGMATTTNQPTAGMPAGNDPLEALSNLGGFWSDADWLRTMQNNPP